MDKPSTRRRTRLSQSFLLVGALAMVIAAFGFDATRQTEMEASLVPSFRGFERQAEPVAKSPKTQTVVPESRGEDVN